MATVDTPDLVPVAPNSPDSAQVGTVETHASTQAAHDEGGGLPQFQFEHWAGQIVWLIFLFAILYALMSKVFAPRLRRVIDERESTIANAVATARSVQSEAAEQAEAAKAEVVQAHADARATATAAKARVTEEAARRSAAEEAVVSARIAEAEAAIGKTRDAAMGNVASIAADTAAAMVERLTGAKVSAAEAAAAVKGAA